MREEEEKKLVRRWEGHIVNILEAGSFLNNCCFLNCRESSSSLSYFWLHFFAHTLLQPKPKWTKHQQRCTQNPSQVPWDGGKSTQKTCGEQMKASWKMKEREGGRGERGKWKVAQNGLSFHMNYEQVPQVQKFLQEFFFKKKRDERPKNHFISIYSLLICFKKVESFHSYLFL